MLVCVCVCVACVRLRACVCVCHCSARKFLYYHDCSGVSVEGPRTFPRYLELSVCMYVCTWRREMARLALWLAGCRLEAWLESWL